MADYTISPNMSLTIPTVGAEAGPTYAFDINASLTLVDQHDHSPGRGVQITPAGMNINADLDLNANNLLQVQTIGMLNNGTPSVIGPAISIALGGESPQRQDLWYTDNTGAQIQITKNGIVNVVASAIEGESYSAGTFFWTQAQDSAPTTPANFDIGLITLRPNVALTTFGVTLQPASSISSQYSLNMPLIPVSKRLVTLDTSGNIVADTAVDGATLQNTSNTLSVAPLGIQASNIANGVITTTQISSTAGILGSQLDAAAGIVGAQIASNTVAKGNLVTRTSAPSVLAGGVAASISSGTYTNNTNTYTSDLASDSVTISVASPAVMTVASTTAYFVGQPIFFTTTGALPTGITANTRYFVESIINSTTFKVTATPGGTAINTSGSQSGAHTAKRSILAVSIVTTGGPLMINLLDDGSGLGKVLGTTAANVIAVRLFQDTTVVPGYTFVPNNVTYGFPSSTISFFIPPLAAGRHTFDLQGVLISTTGVGNSIQISNSILTAYEL